MKRLILSTIGFLTLLTISSFTPEVRVINLHKQVKNKGIEIVNREMSLIKERSHKGIRLSKAYGEGIAWIKGIEFSTGIIEFDVRGENIKQHSFVGIAFHGKDTTTLDAIYLRPFQFKESDETLRSRSIQYISLPDYTWRVLRAKFPTKFEHAIDPSPEPDSWVRVRIVIEKSTISTFINGNKEPSLVVEKMGNVTSGLVGFYVADTSGGDFSNLTITKID